MLCQVSFGRFLGVWVSPEAIKCGVIRDWAQSCPTSWGSCEGWMCSCWGAQGNAVGRLLHTSPFQSFSEMLPTKLSTAFFQWNKCKLREIWVVRLFSAMGFRPLFLHSALIVNGKGEKEKRSKYWKRQCRLGTRLWRKWGAGAEGKRCLGRAQIP